VKVAVIGAGNVGSMIIDLLLRAGVSPDNIIATARSEHRLREVQSRFGVNATRDNRSAVMQSDVVFLCAKPLDVVNIVREIGNTTRGKLVVSCAALLQVSTLQQYCEGPVCRVIPVLSYPHARPILFLYRGTAEKSHIELLRALLRESRIIEVESEDLLDILTVYASSGLAFLYYLLKSYVWGGVAIGLKFEEAQKILVEVLELVLELLRQGVDEESIIRRVATPGGITIEGLLRAEVSAVRGGIMRMLIDAWEKARRAASKLNRSI